MTDDGFKKELLDIFKVEADERIELMTTLLLELEKKATAKKARTEILESLYREAHSLKGAARSVNVTEVEESCQVLESMLSVLRKTPKKLPSYFFDRTHEIVDSIKTLYSSPGKVSAAAVKKKISALSTELESGTAPKAAEPEKRTARKKKPGTPETKQEARTPVPPRAEEVKEPEALNETEVEPADESNGKISKEHKYSKPLLSETVRISMGKIDSLFYKAEELLLAKIASSQRAGELSELQSRLLKIKTAWAKADFEIKEAESLLDKGAELESHEAEHLKSRLAALHEIIDDCSISLENRNNDLAGITKAARQDVRTIGVMVDNLLEDMKGVMMLPFSTLLGAFPRMVRDIAHHQGKNVQLELSGGDIEIDRRVLEAVKDPLIHIVRNCIDHGIENPQEREDKGKPGTGRISISILNVQGDKVEIKIADDGNGIAVDEIRNAAVKSGIIEEPEADALSEEEALSLMFRSDVSTSPIISTISGRGLGLAIVSEAVEELGGVVEVNSIPGNGTTFVMTLPVTIATFRGVLVEAGGSRFVVSTANVEEVVRVPQDEIKTVKNHKTISLNGRVVPFAWLADILEIERYNNGDNPEKPVQVMVLGKGRASTGFGIDRIVDEQEILVKSLGKQLGRVRNVMGATVLGSGKVVPILNVSDLMLSAAGQSGKSKAVSRKEISEPIEKLVLVAEDSITARTLLKNILEVAGFKVKVAVNGADALASLQSEKFDLLVSDVEMPRMDGFELTSYVRANDKLCDLPVVLVTALESREDREKGIEVGADAYVVKSSFDQSNLLEIIKRLV